MRVIAEVAKDGAAGLDRDRGCAVLERGVYKSGGRLMPGYLALFWRDLTPG